MEIRLEKAKERDAKAIFECQVRAFDPLLEKYKDYRTSPARESVDRVLTRINRKDGGFYKILLEDTLIGAICIYWKTGGQFWISPMFILPEYQGKRFAQKTIQLIETLFPEAQTWELATIQEEERNCYLYEKMGYEKTDVSKRLNAKATLIYYKKLMG